jgi:hypothetical protein
VAINPMEVDDMAHAIAWIFEALLRLVLPLSGRHRAADMARPYVVPNEQWSKSRPRVELVCAPHGMVVIR